MKRVALSYGSGSLEVEVPDDASVLRPRDLEALSDPAGAVLAALRQPSGAAGLEDLIGPGTTVAVAFPDHTRPMPNTVVLPPLLAELERLGAGPGEVVLCCATGTHRPPTDDELVELLGHEILERYEVHCHDAERSEHVEVGTVDGVPILLDRRYVDAEVRLTTGFVEPHFFAGFSGGPKGICPGLAGLETILEAHSPRRIADRAATWLELDANPVHRFVSEAVSLAPPALSLDVALTADRALAAVFCGPLPDSHRRACALVHEQSVARVTRPFDVVVTSNAGHPLDQNLYQAVKGMAAAEACVKEGGAIVVLARCLDGIPTPGAFAEVLFAASAPEDLLAEGAAAAPDLWQAQVLGRVLSRAEVHLHTEGLDDEEIRAAHLIPVADLDRLLVDLLASRGRGATLCVLPEGPLSVVEVAS